MQATEAYTGTGQRVDVPIDEKGNREMQDVLSRSLPSFYRKAYRHLGNAADAEDAVQDALFSAFKHLEQFRGESQMSTWLTTIVCNCARMQLRRRVHQVHVSLEEPIGEERKYFVSERLAHYGSNPEDECRRSEFNRRLKRLVAQLSPRLRKTFQLRELDGLNTSEAAHVLGVPEGTVKAQLARARAKLRQSLRRARSTAAVPR